MSDSLLGYLLASGALLLFTASILITKVASNRLDLGLGFLIATSTNVVFSALVLLVQMNQRHEGLHWDMRAFLMFAAAGAFSTYLGRWFFYESVVRFGPAKASIFQISSPLFTALMAWLLLGERLSVLVALGMVMTIAGLMLVSYKPGFFSRRSTAAAIAPDGEPAPAVERPRALQRLMQSVLLLGMGSSLAYAIGNVLRGSAVRDWNEPILGALIGAASGLALQLVFSSGKNAFPPAPGQPQWHGPLCPDRRDHHFRADVCHQFDALYTLVCCHTGDAVHASPCFPAQLSAAQK
jgi:drug/metabolite transporter (DMT)-like permease